MAVSQTVSMIRDDDTTYCNYPWRYTVKTEANIRRVYVEILVYKKGRKT